MWLFIIMAFVPTDHCRFEYLKLEGKSIRRLIALAKHGLLSTNEKITFDDRDLDACSIKR